MCKAALPLRLVSVCQSPMRAFNCSNAAAPPLPGTAAPLAITAVATPTSRITVIPFFAQFIPFLHLKCGLNPRIKNPGSPCGKSRLNLAPKLLRNEPDDEPEEHSGKNDVPKKSHARAQNYQKAKKESDHQPCQ